tara:strand:+ start:2190 stop:2492 length:303 start_codon:yes stop_codon:yes gene_type:complete
MASPVRNQIQFPDAIDPRDKAAVVRVQFIRDRDLLIQVRDRLTERIKDLRRNRDRTIAKKKACQASPFGEHEFTSDETIMPDGSIFALCKWCNCAQISVD